MQVKRWFNALPSAQQPPASAQQDATHQGNSQSSPDRPRWNLLLPEQIKYFSKFRESSCY